MYIALKWLIVLTLFMWLGLCSLDMYLTDYKRSIFLSNSAPAFKEAYKFNNVSALKRKKINVFRHWKEKPKQPGVAFYHYIIFFAGAFIVILYNNKTILVTYGKHNICKLANVFDKYTAAELRKAACASISGMHYWNILRKAIENTVTKFVKESNNEQNTNLALLKRLKDIAQDRKSLSQLLVAAIQENKNIRRQYQIEAVTKNRLLRYIQDAQRLIKEKKSRYVDFKQLYLVTEKENCLLKISLKKMRDEKDLVEKNLMELINEVYKSKNNNLKEYCTRFIVRTQENLLNSDVSAEIQKFLLKSKPLVTLLEESDNKSLYLSNGTISSRVLDILEDDLLSVASSGPRLRGLPGEYVWTVKDKNGIIEKLYEYNFETDYDNGHDVIRRIREYSVYHDKDCFLDHTNLPTYIPTCPSLSASATRIRLDIKSISGQGFLTKLLMNNHALRLPASTETLPLPSSSYL